MRLLPVNNARDRWLTPQEADRLLAVAPPHLQALIRFALATGCRARDHRRGKGPCGPEAKDRVVEPDQERNAARRAAESGCSGYVTGLITTECGTRREQ
jgi:integrase